MNKHGELLRELGFLTLRVEAAGKHNARLLDENMRLRRMAAEQLHLMHELGRDFASSGPILYPGSTVGTAAHFASR